MARAELDVDFFEPSFMQDPYEAYDRIRDLSSGPVWNPSLHGWMVVGYDEGSTVISDTALSISVGSACSLRYSSGN